MAAGSVSETSCITESSKPWKACRHRALAASPLLRLLCVIREGGGRETLHSLQAPRLGCLTIAPAPLRIRKGGRGREALCSMQLQLEGTVHLLWLYAHCHI